MVVGGEQPLTEETILNNECTALARQHNALLMGLEHRYYGESTVGNLTLDGKFFF